MSPLWHLDYTLTTSSNLFIVFLLFVLLEGEISYRPRVCPIASYAELTLASVPLLFFVMMLRSYSYSLHD